MMTTHDKAVFRKTVEELGELVQATTTGASGRSGDKCRRNGEFWQTLPLCPSVDVRMPITELAMRLDARDHTGHDVVVVQHGAIDTLELLEVLPDEASPSYWGKCEQYAESAPKRTTPNIPHSRGAPTSRPRDVLRDASQ